MKEPTIYSHTDGASKISSVGGADEHGGQETRKHLVSGRVRVRVRARGVAFQQHVMTVDGRGGMLVLEAASPKAQPGTCFGGCVAVSPACAACSTD